ncbi:hypothetical protein [Paenibacillus turpanensis]|uniref:hypothetical protein n=1 Tax=Paenibacillus turpanensis TaxID=2689078 RepID=UPI00140AE87E|nr:hypothetical protein [Paenibacillus turpanensis]
MNIQITNASMKHSAEDGYVGLVEFTVEGHPLPYEATFHSTNGKSWSYGLRFSKESGSEELIEAVEEYLDEDDAAFDSLVEAAKAQLNHA